MKTISQKMIDSRAFTIVELIIVIAVIGILATITIVSYSGTRNQADKSSYNATAQQVKMKLSEYYTDNNHFPITKAGVDSVEEYLEAVGASTLKDDFSASDYSYYAYADSSKASCASDEATCQYYEISIPKTSWNGEDADEDIVVKP